MRPKEVNDSERRHSKTERSGRSLKATISSNKGEARAKARQLCHWEGGWSETLVMRTEDAISMHV